MAIFRRLSKHDPANTIAPRGAVHFLKVTSEGNFEGNSEGNFEGNPPLLQQVTPGRRLPSNLKRPLSSISPFCESFFVKLLLNTGPSKKRRALR